jgi:hypothetical protein
MRWSVDEGGLQPRGRGAWTPRRAAALSLFGGLLLAVSVQVQGQTRPEADRFDREVALSWDAAIERSDSLFGGYNVWRATSDDPNAFQLLRRFQRRYPPTWTYPPVAQGTRRPFVDADSVAVLIKVRVTQQGDSAMTRLYPGVQPFNGYPYFYAVTWISECLDARNDTIWVDQPQPEIFPFFRGGIERFGFETESGDTLEVTRVECNRFVPGTNTPDTLRTSTVYAPTLESEIPLRNYAIQATTAGPVYPASTPREDLNAVAVIPNPYLGSSPWEQPGERKIQFINLTVQATVRIYSVGGDLVAELTHPVPGAEPGQGSIDWNLKNGQGRDVASGIYIYQVEEPGAVADVRGRLIIVR